MASENNKEDVSKDRLGLRDGSFRARVIVGKEGVTMTSTSSELLCVNSVPIRRKASVLGLHCETNRDDESQKLLLGKRGLFVMVNRALSVLW